MSYFARVLAELSPAPDPTRLSLEAEGRKWFLWLLISGAVVALGCLLEIPETRFSLMQWWRLKRCRPPREENPASWRVPAASVGLLLVIVGVVGEVVFEGLASNADARLRAHESEVLSAAELKAATANQEAEEAKRDAEAERLQRLQLEARIAWRHLTPEQQRDLFEKVARPFPGQEFGLLMETRFADPEIEDFGRTLDEGLGGVANGFPATKLGWRRIIEATGDNEYVGVIVEVYSSRTESTNEAADALVRWLSAHGILAKKSVLDPKTQAFVGFVESSHDPNKGVQVLVGRRP